MKETITIRPGKVVMEMIEEEIKQRNRDRPWSVHMKQELIRECIYEHITALRKGRDNDNT